MITTLFKQVFTPIIAMVVLSVLSSAAIAEDWSTLDKKKQTKLGLYLTAEQAYKKTMANMDNILFVDIRTPSELNYLGTATVMDVHIPAVFMDTTEWNDKKKTDLEKENALSLTRSVLLNYSPGEVIDLLIRQDVDFFEALMTWVFQKFPEEIETNMPFGINQSEHHFLIEFMRFRKSNDYSYDDVKRLMNREVEE